MLHRLRQRLTLRWKVLLVLCAALGALAAVGRVSDRLVVAPAVLAQEKDGAGRDLRQVVAAVDRERDALSDLARDWAATDACRDYVDAGGRVPAQSAAGYFAKQNFSPAAFTRSRLNLVWVVDPAGKLIWGDSRDERDGSPLDLKDFLPAVLHDHHPLVEHADAQSAVKTLAITCRGPMLLASRPVVGAAGGPVRGAVILGRLLRDEQMTAIAAPFATKLTLLSASDPAVHPVIKPLVPRLASPAPPMVFEVAQPDILIGYTALADTTGQPALLLRAELPRRYSPPRDAAAAIALACNGAACVALAAAAWLILRRMLVAPLAALSRRAALAGRGALDAGQKVRSGGDEFADIAAQIDALSGLIATAAAPQAAPPAPRGPSAADLAEREARDAATEALLRNVGGALDALGATTGALASQAKASKVDGLAKATKLFGENRNDLGRFLTADPKGKRLVDYLFRLSELLAGEQGLMLKELESLHAQIERVRDALALPPATGRKRLAADPAPEDRAADEAVPADEPCTEGDLRTTLEAVLSAHAAAARKAGVKVVREFDEVPPVVAPQQNLRRVLSHLVRNAIEALAARQGGGVPRLTVRARADAEGGVTVEIEDTGVGIDPQQLHQIFDGKPGGGLRFCADTMAAMCGGLSVASDGPGRGATFSVQMPLGVPQSMAVAA